MRTRTWFINGTARGIGLDLVRQSMALGHAVIAGCRAPSTALSDTGATIIDGLDLRDPETPRRLVAALEALAVPSLEVAILNAGVYPDSGTLGALRWEGIRDAFEVNALAQLALSEALAPRLEGGGKLALITSRMGSIADNTSGGSFGYRMSKAALNMAGKTLAIDLAPRGVSVGIIHPGFVRTDMTHGRGLIDPPESAAGILARIASLGPANSGSFWHQNGDPLPW